MRAVVAALPSIVPRCMLIRVRGQAELEAKLTAALRQTDDRASTLAQLVEETRLRWLHPSPIFTATGLTPARICTANGLAPVASAFGLGWTDNGGWAGREEKMHAQLAALRGPHLHREWARPYRIFTATGLTPARICTGNGLAPAASAFELLAGPTMEQMGCAGKRRCTHSSRPSEAYRSGRPSQIAPLGPGGERLSERQNFGAAGEFPQAPSCLRMPNGRLISSAP